MLKKTKNLLAKTAKLFLYSSFLPNISTYKFKNSLYIKSKKNHGCHFTCKPKNPGKYWTLNSKPKKTCNFKQTLIKNLEYITALTC